MNWSLKSIGYWVLLIACLLIGVLFVGSFLLLWTMQVNFAFSLENVFGLATGAIFLAMFFLFYGNRIYFPLKKPATKKNCLRLPTKSKVFFTRKKSS
ncbi:MAG: hypothetical protein A2Z52_02515 [Candidatus Moranbacteria bacterium RBG_19FT_COMBO_42_6]|nr:MAG: hypothetical protein A2Z52_02515 [Candidatus Moranbacteria bacterium RBG_19FT_COMBO_42_6]